MDKETSRQIEKDNESCKETNRRQRERERHREREKDRERERRGRETNRFRPSTTCRSVSGFALPARRHNNQTSPVGFLSLKLPPPPCAVLVVLGAKGKGAKASWARRDAY